MDIKKIHTFLRKNNFTKSTRDGFFYKKINNVEKRYSFLKKGVYLEVKRNRNEDWELLAFADIRKIFINDKGQLSGFERAIPSYSTDKLTQKKKDMSA